MSDSLRTDPRRRRAGRRSRLPAISARKPAAERWHPASPADVRWALERFGPEAYYGLRRIELVPAPRADRALVFGLLAGPGEILLYDQPRSPWRLGEALRPADRARFVAAGAAIDGAGVVVWPDGALRSFMLAHVLAHELGHHILQHERRLRGRRAARTQDHEARAELIAARLRAALA